MSQQAFPLAITLCFDVKSHSFIETIKAKIIRGLKFYSSVFMDYSRKTDNPEYLLTLLMCNEATHKKEHHFSSPTKQSLVLNVFHWWKQMIVQCLIECSFTMRQVNSWHFYSVVSQAEV